MAFTRFADLEFPLIGKPKNHLFFMKLPTNLNVMQRFLYYFKCERLSKQKLGNRTSDEAVLLWQKVAEGSTPGYSCYKNLNTIKSRINTLLGKQRTTLAWGKRIYDKQTNASKIYMAKL